MSSIDTESKLSRSPCIGCEKLTPYFLRTSKGLLSYCGACFAAEMESRKALHEERLRR